ncbi:MAG: aldo/keto reductase [Acidimicrobiia bacterium]|nr:aldo/keto reductase [Acidimicrobiia bacterium]
MDAATDVGYRSSTLAALRGGINLLDTSLNYRHQSSERNIGAALKELLSSGELTREEFVVCTKAGYLVPNALPHGVITGADLVGNMHCLAPAFLEHQLECSRANLGLETIDLFYLHNPETQLGHVSEEELYRRIETAFAKLEQLAAAGRIRYYGAATWNGFRTRPSEAGLSLVKMAEMARAAGGEKHHFGFIQLPFNMAMLEAYAVERETLDGRTVATLEAARRLGITVIASASILQARLSRGLPDEVAERLPGLQTDAQRAIQFARSAPGIASALIGMSQPRHVEENLALSRVEPAELSAWFSKSQ